MKKLDKLILDFLEPVFKEFSNCEKLGFNIYIFDNDDVHACEESISINDISWDQLPDDKLSTAYDKIQEAIQKLPYLDELKELRLELQKVADKTWEKACENSLNKIWRDFWQPENLKPFSSKIKKEFLKRFPSRYVDYVSIEVSRDGGINYYPDGEEE